MSVLATDNFNRADSANLGTNWTIATGSNAIPIASNAIKEAAAFPGVEFNNTVTWPNDQYAQIVHVTPCTTSDNGIGPVVRATGAGSIYFAQSNTVETRIYKFLAGIGFSQLGSDGASVAASDTTYIEAQSSNLVAKKNGSTIITTTDSSLASGSAGIWDSDIAATADNWTGGDFSGGAATLSTLALLGVGS